MNESLSDLIRNGYWLKIVCQCGHEAKLDPVTLRTALHKRGASSALSRLDETLKCQQCGGKQFDTIATFGEEAWS